MPTSPSALFGEILARPLHYPLNWKRRTPREGELYVGGGIELDGTSLPLFPENGTPASLNTALADFREFLTLQRIPLEPGGIRLRFSKLAGAAKGRIRVAISSRGITVAADNPEGLRRGLVWLEDEMQGREGPFLPVGTHERREVIRTRLSRCFHGPIQRPPLNRNELEDEMNYYPDGYLNRLAHDGVTGLWITIKFRESVPSALFPEFGPHAGKHLAKLRATVERCGRFGIKVYLFCIEPAALPVDSPILKRHPELRGAQSGDQIAFCTQSKLGRAYLEEAAATLFGQVPGLGGLVVIPVGERFTSCASLRPTTLEGCPRCAAVGREKVLAGVLEALRRGIDRAAPEAELIAWPYGQMILWGADGMVKAATHTPPGVMLQHNFETGGIAFQLGKPRPLWDYWLSWAGISDVFAGAAKRTLAGKGRIAAKLQVGNSHENATVPFVPVPGLLYRKYQTLHRLGVTGVMQAWYFGTYPSLMTRAAGLLSYAPLPATEREFLFLLARKEWGASAGLVVKAWECFGRGYENFPATHLFSYYGPVQNGVTWPLHLKPRRSPLSPSWKIDFPPSGDYLPHCFSHHFTLRELVTLCSRMAREWQKGCRYLEKAYAASTGTEAQTHERNIAEAIRLQFENAVAILRFYELREALVESGAKPERLRLLDEMAAIAREEIGRRRQFLPLLKQEPTLGYHSEAEGFKITPLRVRKSISQLEQLLEEEFPEVRRKAGAAPENWFGDYTGLAPGNAPQIQLHPAGETAPLRHWLRVAPGAEDSEGRSRKLSVAAGFRIAEGAEELRLEIRLAAKEGVLDGWEASVEVEIEPGRMRPRVKFLLDAAGECRGFYEDGYLLPNPEFSGGWSPAGAVRCASLSLPREALGFPRRRKPFRMNVKLVFFHPASGELRELSWVRRKPMKPRLVWGTTNPATDYGWVFPE